jgi:hypothetical protein
MRQNSGIKKFCLDTLTYLHDLSFLVEENNLFGAPSPYLSVYKIFMDT